MDHIENVAGSTTEPKAFENLNETKTLSPIASLQQLRSIFSRKRLNEIFVRFDRLNFDRKKNYFCVNFFISETIIVAAAAEIPTSPRLSEEELEQLLLEVSSPLA